ncbi:hypothetical protein [Comamonas thiooxydans]|uniref:Uncharacterized protein n=1 Tax=Comamonas thiooxydans TaxID=363952 RepID=A0A0E3BN61_9BURK|nr:hypothetical protein [Comamonas thiooxydans]KGH03577.1 hypothetical protein P608_25045 [Comamonas thiooxydans]KGH17465.1 hypothetical protein P607_16955 [Comamonas thiooxydans]KGH18888.1 hypothetical protein P606_24160 [Comamonas thiooxydans]
MKSSVYLMNKENYSIFTKFVLCNRKFIDMWSSPSHEEWIIFYKDLIGLKYIEGLLLNKKFGSVLIELEEGYQTWRPTSFLAPVDDINGAYEEKKFERRARFVVWFAWILGPVSNGLVVHLHQDQIDRLSAVVTSLKEFNIKGGYLLKDRSFREAVASDKRLDILDKFHKKTEGVLAALEPLSLLSESYFIQRRRKNFEDGQANDIEFTEESRELIGRSADACFRIYGACNVSILKKLQSFDWLLKLKPRDSANIMKRALDKKIREYVYSQGFMEAEHPGWRDAPDRSLPDDLPVDRNPSPPWMTA